VGGTPAACKELGRRDRARAGGADRCDTSRVCRARRELVAGGARWQRPSRRGVCPSATRSRRTLHQRTHTMPAHGAAQNECPARSRGQLVPLTPAVAAGAGRRARGSAARRARVLVAAACGAVLMMLEGCSAFVAHTAGGGATLGRPARLSGCSLAGSAAGLALRRSPAAVRAPRAVAGVRAADLRCAISMAPNSIYLSGDWGLILPAAEDPQRPSLPRLTSAELQQLHEGERVQRQSRVGPVGHGLVVMDVKADIATVLAVLSDVQRYPQRIGTVREAVVHPGGSRNLCKARFKLSRFKLDVQVELYLSKKRNMLEFRLDKNAGMQGAVFDEARGYWYLEACPGREAGWTRVWLNARVQCSPLLPSAVVDYAATKALPRATTWLAPVCEAVESELASRPLGRVYKDVSSLGLGLPLEYF
jgi:hypothetical protein